MAKAAARAKCAASQTYLKTQEHLNLTLHLNDLRKRSPNKSQSEKEGRNNNQSINK